MKQTRKQLLVLVLLFAVAFVPLTVAAEDGTSGGNSTPPATTDNSGRGGSSDDTDQTDSTEPSKSGDTAPSGTDKSRYQHELEQAKEHAKQEQEHLKEAHDKLKDQRLKQCQERSVKINQLLQQNSDRAGKVLAKFEAVVTKVEDYVKSKNLTVDNYAALVADVNAKDQAAAAAIGAVQGTTFSCDNQEANSVGKSQTGVVKNELNALKDLRTSIKTLLQAVKKVAEPGDTTQNSDHSTKTTEQ